MIWILPSYNGTKKGIVYLCIEVALLIVPLAILFLALNAPNVVTPLFPAQELGPALALLKTYNLCYKLILGVMVFSVAMLVVGCPFCLWKIYSGKLASMLAPVVYTILIMGFGLIINYVMFFNTGVVPLIDRSAQDIRQLERGELASMTVSFSKKTFANGMPGPYSSAVAKRVTQYSVTGSTADNATGWIQVLVPDELGFEPPKDGFYNENKSIAYNLENTRRYRITYTDNLKLVVKIEALP